MHRSCARNHSFVRARREALDDERPPTQLFHVKSLFEAPRAFHLFNARRQHQFSKARCAAFCARNHSFVRARREPLDDEVNLADRLDGFSAPPF